MKSFIVNMKRYRALEAMYRDCIESQIHILKVYLSKQRIILELAEEMIEMLQTHVDNYKSLLNAKEPGIGLDSVLEYPTVRDWAVAYRVMRGFQGLTRKKL